MSIIIIEESITIIIDIHRIKYLNKINVEDQKMAARKTAPRATTAKKAVEAKPAAPEKFDEAELTNKAINQFHSDEAGTDVKKITLYLKPEEDAA